LGSNGREVEGRNDHSAGEERGGEGKKRKRSFGVFLLRWSLRRLGITRVSTRAVPGIPLGVDTMPWKRKLGGHPGKKDMDMLSR